MEYKLYHGVSPYLSLRAVHEEIEKFKKEDADGIVTVQTVKKLAAYHQYYAVNRAVESTKRASGFVSKQTIGNLLNESLT